MNPKWTVYRHIHNESGRSYIGMTKYTMMHRWNQHVAQAKSSKNGRWHFPNAIRKYSPGAFSHEVLQICLNIEEANKAEQFWIWTYDTRNPLRGFNIVEGGSHIPHPVNKDYLNPEFKARQSIKMKALWQDPTYVLKNRAANKAALNTPESRAKRSIISKEICSRPEVKMKMSNVNKGKKSSAETRARISMVRKGKKASLETRIKIGTSSLGRKHSELAKFKMSIALIGRKLSPEHIAKLSNKTLSQEHRRKISIATTGRKLSQEHIAKMSGRKLSQEHIAKISIALSGRKFSPEHVANISAARQEYLSTTLATKN